MTRRQTPRLALAALAIMALNGKTVRSTGSVFATFVGQGPAPIVIAGDTSGIAPMAGAIRAIVPDPADANTIYVGSVNGGVWKTTNATNPSPTWTPLTDKAPSLSIGAMEMDPTFPSNTVIVAAIGRASAFPDPTKNKVGGKLAGILRTTDGLNFVNLGAADLDGQNLDAVVPRGNVILVASKSSGGGIYRSVDAGQAWTRLSNDGVSLLPAGKAYDLTGDRVNLDRMYAAIGGASGDVFVNDAAGAGAWTPLGLSKPALNAGLAAASNMKLAAAYDATAGRVLYAAVQDSAGTTVQLFQYTAGAWTELDQPRSVECTILTGIKRNAQIEDLSIAVHPAASNLVFLGGDGQPKVAGPDGDCATRDEPPSGRLFRCDASKPALSQCTPIIGAFTANYTGPHPDSRVLRFDAANDLLNGDDGGIYRRTSPKTSGGDWSSMNGNIAISETHSCAYDAVAGVSLCGIQDNGTALQPSPGATGWSNIGPNDGGRVAVAYDDPAAPAISVRYRSWQNLNGFTRDICPGGACVTSSPQLKVTGTGQTLSQVDANLPFSTPIAANAVDVNRLVIGGSTAVYESTDQGDTLDVVSGAGFGTATGGFAYGGYDGATPHRNVLYACSSNGLYLRKPSETTLSKLGAYSGTPVDVAIDAADWKSVWVVSSDKVRHSADAGATWDNITGDIGDAGAADFRSIVFIPGSVASIVAVGAHDGVYVANAAHPGRWSKMQGALPNAVAYDLSYDRAADLLLVATMGRGVWTLAHASGMNLPPFVTPGPAIATTEGATFSSPASFSDPDGGGEFHSVVVDYGDQSGAHFPAVAADGSFTLSHTYVDNGTYTVSVIAADSSGASDLQTTKATVANVAPAVGAVSVAPSPVALAIAVTASAPFTDPGIIDSHTGTVRWDDGSGPTTATIGGSNTSGTASAAHTYGAAGQYTVTVKVTDKDGDAGSSTGTVVVFDPNGGSVTGSGWIDSPAGAYSANPAAAGKATFSFSAKYKNAQATIPDGTSQFNFHAAGFDFKSAAYEWLIVSGATAQIRGSGTVKGGGAYSFMLTALDGDASGGGGVDKIRMKVWDTATGTVRYDTQMGAPDAAAPATKTGGGAVTIHP